MKQDFTCRQCGKLFSEGDHDLDCLTSWGGDENYTAWKEIDATYERLARRTL